MLRSINGWIFFSHHLGRWLSTLYFEKKIKQVFKRGPANREVCEEATKFAHQFLANVDQQLNSTKFLCGDDLTIADVAAFAYVDQCAEIDFSLDKYPKVQQWLGAMGDRPAIAAAKEAAAAKW